MTTPLATPEEIKANAEASLAEVPHPSLPKGSNLYGSTKIFPDYQAGEGESYLTLVHGIAHESSVSFVACLQALRALRKGYESVLYFYGPAAMNAMATRGFPTTGDSAFPGEQNINSQIEVHRGGRHGLRLPLRAQPARPPRGGPDRRLHPLPPARRAGRADPLRPQGRDHQLDLQPLVARP